MAGAARFGPEGSSAGAGSAETLAAVIAATGVDDERVLDAVRQVPRGAFVPPEVAASAYVDEPLRIGRRQVTTQPSLVARMVSALGLEGDERVLEIGAGYGWQTALIATLVARVWSVERWPELAEAARSNLVRFGIENAEVTVGDGSAGLPAWAPYDAILVSAAFPSVPPPLAAQVRDGGRVVQPIGPGGDEVVTLFERRGERLLQRRRITHAFFVRLYGEHGFSPGGDA